MSELPMFKDLEASGGPDGREVERAPRIVEPKRGQVRIECSEDLLPASHPARLLWDVAGTLDLSRLSEGCEAVEGKAGRRMLSPRMLLTLWMYAVSQAVGSAREIERLTKEHSGFRWIVGDLKVSHHRLSRFRVDHSEAFSQLMTDVLAVLMEKGLLSLELVGQDGTRTRAAATAPSFRTYGSLLECRAQAELQLKAVLAAAEDPEYTRAQHAARAAAAKDYQQRVEAAIATVTELQKSKKPGAKPARASTTDAEARVMKMGDGGFRPALNVQYAVAGSELGGPRTVVGVQVTNVGSDMGSLMPMVEQIERRTGELPGALLADSGHAKNEDIAAVHKKGIDVIVPPPETAKPIETLKQDKGTDPDVLAWRERMETDEAKKLYQARAGLAELNNAHQKTHHGIQQFLVKGIAKATCVVLLHALTSNILQHADALLA
jgi:transposase